MKKLLIVLCAVCLIAGLVSCDSNEGIGEGQELVSIRFIPQLEQEKKLDGAISDADMTVSKYYYKAAPSSGSKNMKGATTDWVALNMSTYETEKCFSAGQWDFVLKGENSKGGLLFQGEVKGVVLKAGTNSASVVLSEKINTSTSEKGNVVLDITTPMLFQSGSTPTLGVKFQKLDGSDVTPTVVTALAKTEDSTNKNNRFSAKYSLAPGLYLVTVSYKEVKGSDTVQMKDSIVALRVVEKTDTRITGNIDESIYVSATLTIAGKKTVKGTVTKAENANTFTFTSSTGADYHTPTSYKWYVDGIEQTTGVTTPETKLTSVLTYAGTEIGNHSVTCVAVYTDSDYSSVYSASMNFEIRN